MLGSDSRLRILQELMRGDRSVSELAGSVDLHPATIRYHLNVLLRDDLIEQIVRRRTGVIGRPEVRFRIREGRKPEGFPPRQYEMLSEILLQVVVDSHDPEDWKRTLYSAGRRAGIQLMEAIDREGKAAWTPRRFVDSFLKGVVARMGMQTEVVDLRRDGVQFRAFTCPFQELAKRYPDKVCDYLDRGFHEGIAEKLGAGVVHERLACIGHGSPFCEYRVRWPGLSAEEAG